MTKRLTVGVCAAVLACLVAGCDWDWLSAAPGSDSVVLAATAGVSGNGNGIMDQLRTMDQLHDQLQDQLQDQDRLRDGTGDNCLHPDGCVCQNAGS